MFSSEPGSAPRRFFDHLAAAGRDAFDLFSVHLYGDPADVPDYLDTARQFMRSHGYLKPVIAGEHGGPQPFEFPDATAVMQQVFAAAFTGTLPLQSTGELAAQAGQDTPERRAMSALYAQMDALPPTLQMFLASLPGRAGGQAGPHQLPPAGDAYPAGLAGGVHRTAYWNLAPEYLGPVDDRQMMYLLIGKLPLLGYEGGRLDQRHPTADTFAPSSPGSSLACADRGPRRDHRPVHAVRLRGRPRRARAPARALGPPRHLRRRGRAAGHHQLAVARRHRHHHRRVRPGPDHPAPGRPDTSCRCPSPWSSSPNQPGAAAP